MKHSFRTPLLPLALAQALYVKAKTPRLPEPDGQRSGTAGSASSKLSLLILGDSAAAGVGVEQQAEALSGHLVEHLAQHFSVTWLLEAQNGLKAVDLVARLNAMTAQSFDIAVLSVGVNDVTGRTHDADWRQQMQQLCHILQSKFGVARVVFSRLPPMEDFPALPRPLNSVLGQRAAQLTQIIREVVAEIEGAELLDPDFPLLPEYIAADGFHPGALAYELWAERLASHLLAVDNVL